MADIKIRLIYNLNSGKKDIYIDYESEDDALPIEHESGHRDIVAQVLGSNVLSEDEVGDIHVERVSPGRAKPASSDQTAQEPQKQSASE